MRCGRTRREIKAPRISASAGARGAGFFSFPVAGWRVAGLVRARATSSDCSHAGAETGAHAFPRTGGLKCDPAHMPPARLQPRSIIAVTSEPPPPLTRSVKKLPLPLVRTRTLRAVMTSRDTFIPTQRGRDVPHYLRPGNGPRVATTYYGK